MTPQDLKKFEESDLAKQAVKLIGQSLEHHLLSKKEFTLVRDYLLITVLIENGSRPGPLENAKVKRFQQATYTKSKGRWTLVVDEHKTTRHQGPAELVMDDRLYGYLKIYVNYIRPAFVHSAAEDALFIKDDGKSFEKGTIGKRVGAFFKKAGVRDDIRVTFTRVRKIFSGAVFQLDPEKKRAVNYHMKHQQKTADCNYVIKLNAARSAEAHRIMKGIISGKENAKGQEDDETHEALETEDANQEEESIRKDHQKTTDRKAFRSAESHSIMRDNTSGFHTEDTNQAEESSNGKSESDDDEMYGDSNSGLTNDDKVVLKSVFKKCISHGNKLSMHEFRHQMRSDLYLRRSVTDKMKVKKMYD